MPCPSSLRIVHLKINKVIPIFFKNPYLQVPCRQTGNISELETRIPFENTSDGNSESNSGSIRIPFPCKTSLRTIQLNEQSLNCHTYLAILSSNPVEGTGILERTVSAHSSAKLLETNPVCSHTTFRTKESRYQPYHR